MKLDALVFDAYGTLFDVHSVMRRCETCWPGMGAALSAAWRAKQLEYTWQRSLMRAYRPFSEVTRDALEHTCEAMGLPLSSANREELMAEYRRLALFPDVALERLGGKKAILSNGSPDMLEPLVAQSGLQFDAVLSVDEVKMYKPAPAVYELAVRKLNTPKEQITFVSSNCWDALGAKSFGFTVYWINRADAPVDRMGLDLDFAVSSLKDLNQKLQE